MILTLFAYFHITVGVRRLPWSSHWCSKMSWLKWHNHSHGPPLRVCEVYNILLLGLPSIIDEHLRGHLHDILRACALEMFSVVGQSSSL